MVEYVAAQANWFLPDLIRLLHTPVAALFPAVPIISYAASSAVLADDDPPWAPLWSRPSSDSQADAAPSVLATIAITEQEHRVSDALVSDRYAWRGYGAGERGEDADNPKQREVTLLAWSAADAVGTMTMGFDDGDGLLADQTYAKKLDSIRSRGRTVCEFTRFAVSSAADSKSTISGLFDLSYVIGRKMLGVTDVVVEVNPRHVGFYKRAFGFEPISDVRTCERVNAPAVLLRLDVSRLEGRMREAGALTPGQLTLARG
jgi:hypothetical protein